MFTKGGHLPAFFVSGVRRNLLLRADTDVAVTDKQSRGNKDKCAVFPWRRDPEKARQQRRATTRRLHYRRNLREKSESRMNGAAAT
jgi:hypothetical protein